MYEKWTHWNIDSIFCVHIASIRFSLKTFWNPITQTSLTSPPAENLIRWITFTKIVRFGWNLVCKLVTSPAHYYRPCPPLPPLPTHSVADPYSFQIFFICTSPPRCLSGTRQYFILGRRRSQSHSPATSTSDQLANVHRGSTFFRIGP